MNIFLNEYFGFCFELNFELNLFSAPFNEKMNFQNVSYRAKAPPTGLILGIFSYCKDFKLSLKARNELLQKM